MSLPDESWTPKIRDKKLLTIRNDAETGVWTGVVSESVPIFNQKMMGAVKYELVAEGRANVIVKVAGGLEGEPKFGATATHGVQRRFRGDRGVEESEIYLPAQPSQNHKNVLLMIVLHEMAHAAGLEEHANDGLFMTLPNISATGTISATKGGKTMPPFFFSNKTVTRMRAIW